MLSYDEKKAKAKTDFDRAKYKAFFKNLLSTIFKINNQLFQFDEVKYLLSPAGGVYRGVRNIPLDNIIGSEGRYNDFDRDFLPSQDHTRDRWEGIDIAKMSSQELPPISVYQIGDYYFVKDGNHRVSVAREQGQEFIDAEVVELFIRVPINEKLLNDKGLLIAESYKYFLEKTRLDELVPGVHIELTTVYGYYRLLEHIINFKYFLGEREKRDPTWEESILKWYYEDFLVLTDMIKHSNTIKFFPGRTIYDLYIWIMDHWHYLKEKYADIELKDALYDYSSRYGITPLAAFWKRFKEWIRQLISGRKYE